MNRKLACLSLAALLCALSLACKKDADINAVIAELDTFTKEIVKRVDANPTAAGVDDAQKYFDSKKDDMTAKLASIKDVRDFQVSEETKKKMLETVTNDAMSLSQLQIKYMRNSMSDPAFKTKLQKLTQDYVTLLQSVGK
jgi:hypothetical protein